MHKCVQVAVGVIKDPSGRILITKRAQDVHMGGRWEFPGGKIESGETPQWALVRELNEELGLEIPTDAVLTEVITPLITLRYAYPTKTVELHVYDVYVQTHWLPVGLVPCSSSGPLIVDDKALTAREGQQAKWVACQDLHQFTFPDANQPIITALMLPNAIPITPSVDADAVEPFKAIEVLLDGQTYPLLHARFPLLDQAQYISELSNLAESLSVESRARVVVNTTLDTYIQLPYSHLHLNSQELMLCADQCENKGDTKQQVKGWLSASCHNLDELDMAIRVGADYVFFSPICATKTHPNTAPVGWDALNTFCQHASMPVYALGGVGLNDISQTKRCGAQGIASISAFS